MDISRGEPNPTNGERVDTMTKMTYVNALYALLSNTDFDRDFTFDGEIYKGKDIHFKLDALISALEKRNASKDGERKPTKIQRENADVKARILEYLTHTLEGLRCGVIAKELNISSQKCSALLTQLVKSGEVVKREGEKRVTLFLLPENDMTDPAND